MNMIRLVLVILAMAAAGRAEEGAAKTDLMLFGGAGVRKAAEALMQAYATNHPVAISATYAGSGQLLGQIAAMRKGDLFMPGEDFYVDQAVKQGLADPASKRVIAWFIPVILVQKGNPKGVKSLDDLARPGLRVGLGDERACAVGRKAVELLAANGIPAAAVASNTLYKSATVEELGIAVRLGQVDAALVWDTTARNFAKETESVAIPPDRNRPSAITLVVLRSVVDPAAAAGFVTFAASDAGKAILRAQHYEVGVPGLTE